jgi:hypothetical protein
VADLRENEFSHPTSSMLFLRALRAALGRMPLWLTTWFLLFALAFLVAMPWYIWYGDALDHNYAPGSLIHNIDAMFRADHSAEIGRLNAATASLAAGLTVLAVLIGVFSAGGWLQVLLERTYGQSLRRFFYGGSRYFWRFLRFWFLLMLVLAGLRALTYDVLGERLLVGSLLGIDDVKELDSEFRAVLVTWAQDGLFALFVGLTLVWGVYTRTRLALHDTTSTLWAGMCTFFTIVRHPLTMLRPFLFLFLAEVIVLVLIAGNLTEWLGEGLADESGHMQKVVLMFVVGQVALMWRQVIQGAGYYAAVKVSQEVLRPLSRPDPWKTIGGPGGPQYPVDGGDEYGVAL